MSAASGLTDTNADNNKDCVTVTKPVASSIDVALAKTVGQVKSDPATGLWTFSYTLDVTNPGNPFAPLLRHRHQRPCAGRPDVRQRGRHQLELSKPATGAFFWRARLRLQLRSRSVCDRRPSRPARGHGHRQGSGRLHQLRHRRSGARAGDRGDPGQQQRMRRRRNTEVG
ncbi:MAG: hypothetical protein WDM84_05795 [Bauldia sp.]